jgi:predicted SAM-dependent methyltransferase
MADLLRYLDEEYPIGIKEGQNSWRARAKDIVTALCTPMESRKAAQLVRENCGDLKLHIGCGDTYIDGWINIDMVSPGKRRDVQWDLRRGLPFPDRSVNSIFSEHLFEHIPVPDGLRLLRECRRVLTDGAVIRIGVPDLGRYINSYLEKDSIIDDVRPGRATRALALSELFYFHGHRAMYDAQTLRLLLETAGYSDIVESNFGDSAIVPCPDSALRQLETLYVEARA